jgi:hypothetical protein
MAKSLTYDSEKGYHVGFDVVTPSPGTSEGFRIGTSEDEDEVYPVRSLVFKSADDSNVKVTTNFDPATGQLEVTIGVYYV